MSNPFRYFNSSPEVIRLVVMMYVRYPLSLRNVEDLLAERGINISPRPSGFGGTGLGRYSSRSLRTLQKFSSVHAQVHNQFNQDRHLVTRQIYKQRRSAALAEWRALAV
jgi:hypothetical protein